MIKYTLTEGTWSSMPRDKDPRSWRSGWKSASSAPHPPKKPPKKKPESLVETRNLGRIRKGLLVGKEISLSLSLSSKPRFIFFLGSCTGIQRGEDEAGEPWLKRWLLSPPPFRFNPFFCPLPCQNNQEEEEQEQEEEEEAAEKEKSLRKIDRQIERERARWRTARLARGKEEREKERETRRRRRTRRKRERERESGGP